MSGRDYAGAVREVERAARFGINPSLEAMAELCAQLGDPQHAAPAVQVTGSNGKTSVTRMTAALLRTHGVRTGAYTSPHLHGYRERAELDGEPVSEEGLARAVWSVLDASGAARATQFELLTAAYFVLMREARAEASVLEVGMGGRWDATSVVRPRVAVITGVGLEHTEHLGPTVEAIAGEKAAIVREGSVAVLGPRTADVDAVFAERAAEVGAPVVRVREQGGDAGWRVIERPGSPGGRTVVEVAGAFAAPVELRVAGPAYQAPNAAVAVAAAEAFLGSPLDPAACVEAFEALRFPARFELLREDPPLVADGAHNPQAASVLAEAIADAWPREKPVLLLGALSDKDAEGIVRALAPAAGAFVCCRSASDRALGAAELAGVVEAVTGVRPDADDDLASALDRAVELAGPAGVLATGSLTVAAEVIGLASVPSAGPEG